MKSILTKIKDTELTKLIGSVKDTWSHRLISEYFKRKAEKYKQYDPDLLWILMYQTDFTKNALSYLDVAYQKFREEQKIIDADFARQIVLNGNFHSRYWELIVCDVLSHYGSLLPKKTGGPDFLLQTQQGELINIEAISLNEAQEPELQAEKPVYDEDNMYVGGGEINAHEKPIVLRFLHGFDKKAAKGYPKDKPLILAINVGKTVGLTSLDDHVLRQALFGLGCVTISLRPDGTTYQGFQQTPILDKGGGPFEIARFRDEKYSFISGIIYSSQKPYSLIPDTYGWTNSPLVYVPNPLAKFPVTIDFDTLRNITVTENEYVDEPPRKEFKSIFST